MEKKHTCLICNKNYSSASSLYNHKRVYHASEKQSKKDTDKTNNKTNDKTNNNLEYCKYCGDKFKYLTNKRVHEYRCRYIPTDLREPNDIDNEQPCTNIAEKIREQREIDAINGIHYNNIQITTPNNEVKQTNKKTIKEKTKINENKSTVIIIIQTNREPNIKKLLKTMNVDENIIENV